MSERLDPEMVFDMIGRDLPDDLRPNILVVGSLAAAYHFREEIHRGGITTKDADIVVHPAGALAQCQQIATRLLEAGWRRTEKCYPMPRDTSSGELRAIRLNPPDSEAYFVELLAFPELRQREPKAWFPCEVKGGWYGLPSFRFLGLAEHGALETPRGLRYAAPTMMALANLLSHPRVGTERMSEPIGRRALLRSAKDLGRVLALARLAGRTDTEAWASHWAEALRARFGDEAEALAAKAGAGLRELLDDATALDEARHAVDVGLLAGEAITVEQLFAIGRRLLADAIDPLAEALRR